MCGKLGESRKENNPEPFYFNGSGLGEPGENARSVQKNGAGGDYTISSEGVRAGAEAVCLGKKSRILPRRPAPLKPRRGDRLTCGKVAVLLPGVVR